MADSFDSWLSDRANDEPVDDGILSPGTVVGNYRIVALLGSGGFADVYRAKTSKGRRVAIKILHRLDEKSRRRFERESEILSQIWHPNFPKLLGFGLCGDRPYMVTELLQASILPSEDRKVAKFLGQIISAADALHRGGYVHRDIKPSNILARDDGTPVLIDFGLVCPISAAKREREALSVDNGQNIGVGTAGYSAPEQFTGAEVGPEADIHAIGVLIKECFYKKLPRCWKRIYLTATNSDPAARYHSAAELSQAIRWRHLRKLWATIAVMLVGGLVALAIGFLESQEQASGDSEEPVQSRADYSGVVGPTFATGCKAFDSVIGNRELLTASGYTFTIPFVYKFSPADAPLSKGSYWAEVRVVYHDASTVLVSSGSQDRILKLSQQINDWLREFLDEQYSGIGYGKLMETYLSGELVKDVNSGFAKCLAARLRECESESVNSVSLVTVNMRAKRTLERDLKNKCRKSKFAQSVRGKR